MAAIRSITRQRRQEVERAERIKIRKQLNADALIGDVRNGFAAIEDHRAANVKHKLPDVLTAGFAMFSLKFDSLLEFDKSRKWSSRYMDIYGLHQIPCDSSLRNILDGVTPVNLRPIFTTLFRRLQRGKSLEKYKFLDEYYLVSPDGTGFFSSKKLSSPVCMEKTNKDTGEKTYHIQMLGAAIVHPDNQEVIPLCPEMIRQQDGATKGDSERNAAKRFFADLRREHPHLKMIVIEDSLHSNAPHIRELQKHNLRFIIGAKKGDHKYLFYYVSRARRQGRVTEILIEDKDNPHVLHSFRYLNGAPLNKSHQDIKINFLEYWEVNTQTGKEQHFSWITDLTITKDNVFDIMRAGRARWKTENETFNTLKNQGYNLEHNYGLGKKNLRVVFVMLMMLAFLVDQIQQICCKLFNAVRQRLKSKKTLWETIRAFLRFFRVDSMETLFRWLLRDICVELPSL